MVNTFATLRATCLFVAVFTRIRHRPESAEPVHTSCPILFQINSDVIFSRTMRFLRRILPVLFHACYCSKFIVILSLNAQKPSEESNYETLYYAVFLILLLSSPSTPSSSTLNLFCHLQWTTICHTHSPKYVLT